MELELLFLFVVGCHESLQACNFWDVWSIYARKHADMNPHVEAEIVLNRRDA